MNDKSVLITGGNGFIGQYVAKLCQDSGYQVYCIGRNINPGYIIWDKFLNDSLESISLTEALQSKRFVYCFHFAGSSHVPLSVDQPYQDFLSLLPGTANLLLYLAKYQPDCHCVIASSVAVYGNPQSLPITESASLSPISPYGIHKRLAEQLAAEYSRVYGLKISIMRIFSAYGVGLKKQLLWDLVVKVDNAIRAKSGFINLFGTGEETRDFIHAKDIAGAALCIASRRAETNFEIFNVANEQETTVREVASLIVGECGSDLSIQFSGINRFGDPLHWRGECSKLKRLGYKKTMDFQLSVREYYKWAVNQLSYDQKG